VRVVVAGDNTLLREGLAALLTEAGFEVAASVEDAAALLAEVARHGPDVAIVDIRLPPTRTDEGLRAAREIRRRHPGTDVLVLSQYVRVSYTVELLDDGAKGVGYLLKTGCRTWPSSRPRSGRSAVAVRRSTRSSSTR
jgi:DNA-binding NarL/FixJ family response regulator